MAKHVRKVFVCDTVGTATTTDNMVIGALQFFNEKKQPVASATAALTGNSFYVGTKVGTDNIYMSDKITRDKIEKATTESFRNFTPSSAVITLSNPTIGNRYVLRIAYNDVLEMPIQFTQSFEVYATDATAATLATAFAAAINSRTTSAGRNARVSATAAAGVLTLTAKNITIDDTIDTLYEFHAIEIQDVTVTSNGTAAFSSKTVTASDAGVGYWKVVRDIEKRSLGNRGTMFFNYDKWFNLTGTQRTAVDAQYDVIDILYNNDYRSADNQFIKNTPLETMIFIRTGVFAAADFTAIKTWATGVDDNAEAATDTDTTSPTE